MLWADPHSDPPSGAIVVGEASSAGWVAAAAFPENSIALLPDAGAWLSARLGGVGGRNGRILSVAGLGESPGTWQVIAALADTAADAGLSTVVVDADPRTGPKARGDVDAGPGWGAAQRWAADGSSAAFPGLLPSWRSVALLSWAPGEGLADVGPEGLASVCRSLAATSQLVIVGRGPVIWPSSVESPGEETLLVIGEAAPLASGGRRPTLAAALVSLRGRRGAQDGPRAARLLGAQWCGSARAGKNDEPSRSLRRLARRVWEPRLAAGVPLGTP